MKRSPVGVRMIAELGVGEGEQLGSDGRGASEVTRARGGDEYEG